MFEECSLDLAVALDFKRYLTMGYDITFKDVINSWNLTIRKYIASQTPPFHMPKIYRLGGKAAFIEKDDYFCKGKKCLSSPLDDNYFINNSLYNSFKDMGFSQKICSYNVVDIRGVENFESWLKNRVHNNFRPHFFGQKSKRVCYYLSDNIPSSSYAKIWTDMIARQIEISNEEYKKKSNENLNFLFHDNIIKPGKVGPYLYIIGVDVETDTPVAILSIKVINSRCWVAYDIYTNKSEDYKPYSLVLCSHIAAIREAAKKKVALLDLGLNFTDIGDYKKVIDSLSIPMFNFPSYEVNPNVG